MFKNVARTNLLSRLLGAGVNPHDAASIVMAVYPDRRGPVANEYARLRPKVAADYAEQFIDQGLSLEELFERLYGCSVETYFQAA